MSFGMFGAIFLLVQFLQFALFYSPLEAGLGWAVQLERDFIGRDALVAGAVQLDRPAVRAERTARDRSDRNLKSQSPRRGT